MRESEEVDPQAWALLLTELLAAAGMTPEQAGAPVGPVPTNWRTIRRWLTPDPEQTGGVSVVKVRDTCRALNYPVLDGLVRCGFLTREEARMGRQTVSVSPPLPAPLRQIADVLTDTRVPEEAKTPLRRGLAAAWELWLNMYKLRAPRERSARERGATPDRPSQTHS